jgi:hypothetical protein
MYGIPNTPHSSQKPFRSLSIQKEKKEERREDFVKLLLYDQHIKFSLFTLIWSRNGQ